MKKRPSQDKNFQPKKRLGQHWLRAKTVLKKIIAAADLKPTDTVLEIGPGTGVLTRELAKKVKKVVAIEKDKTLISVLAQNLKEFQNIKLISEDVLFLDPKPYTLNPYKLVANLPYYIATRIIRSFLETERPPKLMVLMVQKEVGQRICARPPRMSLLAASVQFYAEAKIIGCVSKKAFWPRPKVDSAIIKIVPRTLQKNDGRRFFVEFEKRFFEIIKAGFSQPRKQLANNLAKNLKLTKEMVRIWLAKNSIKPEQRAQTLSLENWLALTKGLCYNKKYGKSFPKKNLSNFKNSSSLSRSFRIGNPYLSSSGFCRYLGNVDCR